MDSKNLALVFTPSLMRSPYNNTGMMAMQKLPEQKKAVDLLIQHYQALFNQRLLFVIICSAVFFLYTMLLIFYRTSPHAVTIQSHATVPSSTHVQPIIVKMYITINNKDSQFSEHAQSKNWKGKWTLQDIIHTYMYCR